MPSYDPTGTPVLEARGITKRFPGVVANNNVSLTIHKGQIVGLLGENGAGKSTLVKMIYGLYEPDEGEILMNGSQITLKGPRDAIRRGIGMVHQHFQLVPVFTVAENVILGDEPHKSVFVNMKKATAEVARLSEEYGLKVDVNAKVEDLPVGAQQRVEILKALYRKAEILIMDEPTAVLTPQETDELLKVMRGFADNGVQGRSDRHEWGRDQRGGAVDVDLVHSVFRCARLGIAKRQFHVPAVVSSARTATKGHPPSNKRKRCGVVVRRVHRPVVQGLTGVMSRLQNVADVDGQICRDPELELDLSMFGGASHALPRAV